MQELMFMSHWQMESPDRLHGAVNQLSHLSVSLPPTVGLKQLSCFSWMSRQNTQGFQLLCGTDVQILTFLVFSFLPEVKAQLFRENGWPSEASGPTVAHVSSWFPPTPAAGPNSADRTPRSSPSRDTHTAKLGMGDVHHVASLNSCLN